MARSLQAIKLASPAPIGRTFSCRHDDDYTNEKLIKRSEIVTKASSLCVIDVDTVHAVVHKNVWPLVCSAAAIYDENCLISFDIQGTYKTTSCDIYSERSFLTCSVRVAS